ncbi:MAG: hypothetical protein Ct9H300mP25_14480 [Acidobacteriota bacterium]|nr:MAG: hypothetical protein Ct9H300mP25_14480 [Acidobacteriota bacterium]
MLDGLGELNRMQHEDLGNPETLARIQQYEMAYRMQMSVPEMADLASEPDSTFDRWGEEAKQPGKFQNAALMARRLVERGVRFVQIYHRGWDVHSFAPEVLPAQARDVDRAAWSLIQDLKERGLFDETLVIWGGEFGRTIYSQGRLTPTDYGRDHHPRCFSLWWLAAESRVVLFTERRMSSRTTLSKTRCTFVISRQLFFIFLESITRDLRINIVGWMLVSRVLSRHG